MSSDYDIKIKSLFDQAKTDQPDPAFTHQVMRRIRNEDRKARLMWLATLVIAIGLLWVITPDLQGMLVNINGFVDFTSNYTTTLITEAGTSPVTWIFVVPVVVSYLYINRRRFI